jgi:hypothetical protein
VVVGFGNGDVQQLGARDVPFIGAPSTPVVRLLAGPSGTMIVGYANGLIGIWALDNGARLYATRLHGPIAHIVNAGDRLYVASELGDHTTLDLAPFTQPRCELLAEIWRAVPVAWENGLAVLRAPPADHACRVR